MSSMKRWRSGVMRWLLWENGLDYRITHSSIPQGANAPQSSSPKIESDGSGCDRRQRRGWGSQGGGLHRRPTPLAKYEAAPHGALARLRNAGTTTATRFSSLGFLAGWILEGEALVARLDAEAGSSCLCLLALVWVPWSQR